MKKGNLEVNKSMDALSQYTTGVKFANDLNMVVEDIIRQLEEKPAIDNVTFEFEQFGKKAKMTIKRQGNSYDVKVEDPDLTPES